MEWAAPSRCMCVRVLYDVLTTTKSLNDTFLRTRVYPHLEAVHHCISTFVLKIKQFIGNLGYYLLSQVPTFINVNVHGFLFFYVKVLITGYSVNGVSSHFNSYTKLLMYFVN